MSRPRGARAGGGSGIASSSGYAGGRERLRPSRQFHPVVHALEYQGSGHHIGNFAAARDAVKKEALRKAGIGYHEVVAGHTTAGELRALVEKLVPVG